MNYFIVNAFTENPDGGNPAAVCLPEKPLPDNRMQRIAAEFGLSETAFLESKEKSWGLRWFTPSIEIELCGHATLASAHVLWQQGITRENAAIRFETKSGLLTVEKRDGIIVMDFPKEEASGVQCPSKLIKAIGTQPFYTGKNRFDYIVEIESERLLKDIRPDFDLLMSLEARGIIVTSLSESDSFDFVSRFFAPAVGVPEDPVTGSAHCCLAPYWSDRLGKSSLVGFQSSQRGGIVHMQVKENRVFLGGKAITFASGKLMD